MKDPYSWSFDGIKEITFSSAKDFLTYLRETGDLYNHKVGMYLFLYNEEGSIAHYCLNKYEVINLSENSNECWSALLGPDGYIHDGAEALDLAEKCYNFPGWLATSDVDEAVKQAE